jgi:hypothetical protein
MVRLAYELNELIKLRKKYILMPELTILPPTFKSRNGNFGCFEKMHLLPLFMVPFPHRMSKLKNVLIDH